jgi:hypothetical protein
MGKHDAGAPSTGVWAKFDYYNRKLEHKMGIETVSVVVSVHIGHNGKCQR